MGTDTVLAIGSVDAADDLDAARIEMRQIGQRGDPVITASAIAAEIGDTDGVLVVSITSAADAISAAALAVAPVQPILFSRRDTVPQASVDAWRALGEPAVTVVGGTAVIGDNIQRFFEGERLAGRDRYATSVATVKASIVGGRSADDILVATGTSFADALAVAPLAGEHDGVALLVDGSGRGGDRASMAWLGELDDDASIEVVGGSAAVSSRSEQAIGAAVNRV